jgi:hypothetical protein
MPTEEGTPLLHLENLIQTCIDCTILNAQQLMLKA